MSVEITRLPSGLTVVTDAMPHLETASLGVFVGAGGRSERGGEHGIAHMLEHMAFKGTTTRSARQISEEIETVGGDLNAATSAEQTAYYARVLKGDVGLGLNLLTDILTNSVFDDTELDREKNVIIQEIGAVEDTPDDLVFDLFNETAFPDQPLGRRILGTPETVSSFDRTAIRSYLDRQYRAPDMVVSAAGAVEHGRIVDEVALHFADLSTEPGPAPDAARYGGGEVLVESDHEQVNVVLGFAGRAHRDPDLQALGIFTNLLGGGMSSRLFQEVREQRGLCYSIYSFHWSYADSGLFGISAGAGPADVADLVPVILDVTRAAVEQASEAEVARAKAQMKAGLLMALESSSVRAEQMARHVLVHGRPLSPAEIVARVEAVTVDDVRRVGRSLLSCEPTVAAIGPLAAMPRHEAVRRHLAA